MEEERSLLHVLTEHPFILFAIGTGLIMVIVIGIGILAGKRAGRKDAHGRQKQSK